MPSSLHYLILKFQVWQRYDATGKKIEVNIQNKDNKEFSIFRYQYEFKFFADIDDDLLSVFPPVLQFYTFVVCLFCSPVDRIRLLSDCINRLFRLEQMVDYGIMHTYYVLHQRPIKDELLRNW